VKNPDGKEILRPPAVGGVPQNDKNNILKIILLTILALSSVVMGKLSAATNFPFTVEVNSNNINIRSDSTISAAIICAVNKSRRLEVVAERYDWYKVKLPRNAPSYIKKDFISNFSSGTTTVSGDNVNIRLSPNETSPILGEIDKDTLVNIKEDLGSWVRIEGKNSFGWINKKFVTPVTGANRNESEEKAQTLVLPMPNQANTPAASQPSTPTETVIFEGIVKPLGIIFNRPATHKLILENNEIYLLKGNKKELGSFNQRKAKVTGKIDIASKLKYPLIEVEKIILTE